MTLGTRRPAHAFRFFVDAGGLMSYGATTSEIYTTAAEQVAKILGGARPSELPLRQATRFEPVINNRTASAGNHDRNVAAGASRRISNKPSMSAFGT